MKEIVITQGKVALVDDEDYKRISQHKWFTVKGSNTFYAARWTTIEGKRVFIRMHREVLGLTKNDRRFPDHTNQNGLDNQKHNLRIAGKSLNGYNCKKYVNNPSGYRGVTKRKNRWRAAIRVDGKLRHLGSFADLTVAAKAYDAAVLYYRGDHAPLNFPQEAK